MAAVGAKENPAGWVGVWGRVLKGVLTHGYLCSILVNSEAGKAAARVN